MSDLAMREAERRQALHREVGDYREPFGGITGSRADLEGMRGEEEFGRVFNLPVRTDLAGPGGDDGWDFILPLRVEYKVDVKASSHAGNLLVPVGEVVANTIYVLAKCESDDRTGLLGWEWGHVLLRAPSKDFGRGVISHYIAAGKLRPIDELLERFVR